LQMKSLTVEAEAAGVPLRLDSATVFAAGEEEDRVALLRDISLEIAPGEWVNVVGVNGSGKSTLARLLAGIVPPGLEGAIRRGFAGEGASPIVLQQPKAQLFGETPREEAVFALEWRGAEAGALEGLAERALSRAGLAELADEPWERLSGGQRQLAAFVAATAADAPLVVLDEATSMLDDDNRRTVRRLARELCEGGAAVVWVTQRLDELEPDDRVVAIGDGRLVFDGRGREFLYGSSESDGLSGSEASPITPCLGAGLRLPYLPALALELRRLGKLKDPLPMTEREWQHAWGNASNGKTIVAEPGR